MASHTPGGDLASIVLVEALGASVTPFVPLPFVDDWLFERLLRRAARKVLERAGVAVDAKAIVDAYVKDGDSSLGVKAVTAAARFVIRKVAVVLDVKKSHDVFGEAIAFAIALDVALAWKVVRPDTAEAIGIAIHRATKTVGSGALEHLTRAARDAFAAGQGSIAERARKVGGAIGHQVEETRRHLEGALGAELRNARLL